MFISITSLEITRIYMSDTGCFFIMIMLILFNYFLIHVFYVLFSGDVNFEITSNIIHCLSLSSQSRHRVDHGECSIIYSMVL